MLPAARQALRRIGADNDVLTYVSDYARATHRAALGPTAALEYLPPGVDADRSAPDPAGRARIRRAIPARRRAACWSACPGWSGARARTC